MRARGVARWALATILATGCGAPAPDGDEGVAEAEQAEQACPTVVYSYMTTSFGVTHTGSCSPVAGATPSFDPEWGRWVITMACSSEHAWHDVHADATTLAPCDTDTSSGTIVDPPDYRSIAMYPSDQAPNDLCWSIPAGHLPWECHTTHEYSEHATYASIPAPPGQSGGWVVAVGWQTTTNDTATCVCDARCVEIDADPPAPAKKAGG